MIELHCKIIDDVKRKQTSNQQLLSEKSFESFTGDREGFLIPNDDQFPTFLYNAAFNAQEISNEHDINWIEPTRTVVKNSPFYTKTLGFAVTGLSKLNGTICFAGYKYFLRLRRMLLTDYPNAIHVTENNHVFPADKVVRIFKAEQVLEPNELYRVKWRCNKIVHCVHYNLNVR